MECFLLLLPVCAVVHISLPRRFFMLCLYVTRWRKCNYLLQAGDLLLIDTTLQFVKLLSIQTGSLEEAKNKRAQNRDNMVIVDGGNTVCVVHY